MKNENKYEIETTIKIKAVVSAEGAEIAKEALLDTLKDKIGYSFDLQSISIDNCIEIIE